eukprot:SAG11_NODE_681_length_7772_cov_26.403362_2_plen_74_part_00
MGLTTEGPAGQSPGMAITSTKPIYDALETHSICYLTYLGWHDASCLTRPPGVSCTRTCTLGIGTAVLYYFFLY